MLANSSYPAAYVEACRARLAAQISSYLDMMTIAASTISSRDLVAAVGVFEAALFNNLVLALDHHFVHRLRAVEGTDGNPLNEVRMLANSIMANAGVLQADRTIRYDPARSVTGLAVGDTIRMSMQTFERLRDAFLAEILAKYP